MDFILKKFKEDNLLKIKVLNKDIPICEYCINITGELSEVGERLAYTTLTLWSLLDFCLSRSLFIDFDLIKFEQDYIEQGFEYCTKLYERNYNLKIAMLKFSPSISNYNYPSVQMDNRYLLGYTEGKDSTLCKLLLEDLKKQIEYYKVSYDDDKTLGEGRIYNNIIDEAIYNKNTITGYKSSSNLVSFQQADDIHITFIAPFIYNKKSFPSNLAVGLPYDAVHHFKDDIPDLVPTETYKSIEMLENLMHNYGFNKYQIISPIATIHTFGVYNLLSKIIGFSNLMRLDSCWETTSTNNAPCGMCPKCQRLKYIFKKCFNMDYLPNIPSINITSSDFLFGSVHATELLKKYDIQKIKNTQFLHSFDNTKETEFIELLKQKYNIPICEIENVDFVSDRQTWNEVLDQIANIIGIDYRLLSDEAIKHGTSFNLPFEKYYNWNRVNLVLDCYKEIEYGNIRNTIFSRKLVLPNDNIFKKSMVNKND